MKVTAASWLRILLVVVALSILLSEPPTVSAEDADSGSREDTETVPFGFDFFPFVGTSSALPSARREVSLNLIGGISGGTDQVELGSLLNINTGSMQGVQLAGSANVVTADVDGVQGAGALNIVTASLNGLQGAGAGNIIVGDVNGLQVAGAGNVVAGESNGLQGAGAANVVSGGSNGLQGAGAANVVVGHVGGAQLSGGLNLTTGDLQGMQLGVANITAGEVEGLQLGIFNYATDSTASIGLVSIVPRGFTDIEIFGSEEGLALAGLRHGTERIYNVYYLGSRLSGDEADFAYGLGLGWRRSLGRVWELNIDTTATQVVQDGNFEDGNTLTKLRTLASWRGGPNFALFGGPTFTLHLTDTDTEEFDYLELWSFTDDDDEIHAAMWVGATVGLRFL